MRATTITPQSSINSLRFGKSDVFRESRDVSDYIASLGVTWPPSPDMLTKAIRDETHEFEQARDQGAPAAMKAELGDILFSVARLAHHYGIDPASALAQANAKIRGRFETMQRLSPVPLAQLQAPEWKSLWDKAKQRLQDTAH